jgi:hypothetical protein
MKREFDYQKLVMGSLMARKQRNNKYQELARKLLPEAFIDLVPTITSKQKFLAACEIIAKCSDCYTKEEIELFKQCLIERV